jgi:hypothetical protein
MRIPNTAFEYSVFSDPEQKTDIGQDTWSKIFGQSDKVSRRVFLITKKTCISPLIQLIITEISNNARLASDINPDRNPEIT